MASFLLNLHQSIYEHVPQTNQTTKTRPWLQPHLPGKLIDFTIYYWKEKNMVWGCGTKRLWERSWPRRHRRQTSYAGIAIWTKLSETKLIYSNDPFNWLVQLFKDTNGLCRDLRQNYLLDCDHAQIRYQTLLLTSLLLELLLLKMEMMQMPLL